MAFTAAASPTHGHLTAQRSRNAERAVPATCRTTPPSTHRAPQPLGAAQRRPKQTPAAGRPPRRSPHPLQLARQARSAPPLLRPPFRWPPCFPLADAARQPDAGRRLAASLLDEKIPVVTMINLSPRRLTAPLAGPRGET